MGSQPENTNSLEWMLHDSQIDDSTLAEALVVEYYAGLYSFASALDGKHFFVIPNPVIETIATAVHKRHHFWNETSLRSWLYRHAYLIYKKDHAPNRLPIPESIYDFLESKDLERDLHFESLGKQDTRIQIPLMLAYGHGLSEDEIAYVFATSASKIHSSLNHARRHHYFIANKDSESVPAHPQFLDMLHLAPGTSLDPQAQLELEKHMLGCLGCRNYREKLPALENVWIDKFRPVPIEPEQVQFALQEIGAAIGVRTTHRKLYFLPDKEISLVLVVLLALYFIGSTQGVFEAYDSRPTITPRPTYTPVPTRTPVPTHTPAARPAELNGFENEDYFYFDAWTSDRDTWESVASKAGLRVDMVHYLNPTLSDPLTSSTRIRLVGLKSSGLFHPLPLSSNHPNPELLTSGSSAAEVLERVWGSSENWSSIWMDQLFVSNGPPGYSGPPLSAYRIEVYASHPELWISLQNDLETEIRFITYGAGNWVFGPKTGGSRLFANWAPGGFQGPASPFYENRLRVNGNYQVAGEEEIAGRQAILLDGYDATGNRQQRLWIDALTGMLLKTEMYGGPEEDIIIFSMVVQAVQFDIPFPKDLFYPPSSAFLQYMGTSQLEDYQANRENKELFSSRAVPVRRIPPPPGFDLAQSPLLMRFPDRPGWEEAINEAHGLLNLDFAGSSGGGGMEPGTGKIQVYVGEYYLGELELENVLFNDCRRSADGQLVALVTSKDRSRSNLAWFDLTGMELRPVTELAGGSQEFAFSPDSQRLAFANCRISCGLSILELETGQVEQIGPAIDWITSLDWSPDGEQIAFMTHRWPQNPQVHVIEAENGAVVFTGEYDYSSGKMITPGSPTELWNRPYPPFREATGCMLP